MRKDTVMSQGYQPGTPTWYQMPQGAAPSRPPAVPDQTVQPHEPPRQAPVQRHPAPSRAASVRPASSVRRSRLLLAACVIGTLSLILTVYYMISVTGNALKTDDAIQGLGTVLAMGLATPFAVAGGIATVFAWIGYGTLRRGFVLTAAILYSIAIVLLFVWFYLVIVQMILCYVSYARMKRMGKP